MTENLVMARQGVANVGIQLASLISKSLLLFILARFLPVAEVGVFGLLAVSLSFGIHLLGLDFYAFAQRELLAAEPARLPTLLRDQLILHLATYPVALSIGLLPFVGGALPWGLLGTALALLITEHLGQEIQRALVTLGRPVQGALVLFIRSGAWVWVVAAMLVGGATEASLRPILTVWLSGSAAGILLGAFFLRDLEWKRAAGQSIDWNWLARGLRVAVPFLVASLSYRGLLTVDRYALEYLAGLEAVGIYSFYANFRNAILSFVEMGILFVYRPRVVAAWQADPGGRPSELLARMARLLVAAPVLLALLAAAAVPLVLDFVGETAYRGHQAVLWILLAAAAAASIAEIPHTVLYARHRDRALISSNLLALALAVPLHVVLILRWDLVGAAAASFGSFAILAALKAGLLRGDRR